MTKTKQKSGAHVRGLTDQTKELWRLIAEKHGLTKGHICELALREYCLRELFNAEEQNMGYSAVEQKLAALNRPEPREWR